MEKRSKILLTVAVVLVLASVILTYYRFMVAKNYIITNSQETDLAQ